MFIDIGTLLMASSVRSVMFLGDRRINSICFAPTELYPLVADIFYKHFVPGRCSEGQA